jgi:MbtH protein
MTNPFDVEDGTYSVLVNGEGQHSIWPAFAPVPAGWTVVHGPDGREACLDHVRTNWTDMRPLRLVTRMGRDSHTA